MILPYRDLKPKLSSSTFLAQGAVVTGDVRIGEESSIWYNTVIRGDVAPTFIGNRVNIQDNATLHQSPSLPLIIEDDVTIGHQVILHSCHIKRGALIGMGSIIMDGAEVGEEALVGAGSLVPPGKKIPARSLAVGSPAKVVRQLSEKDFEDMRRISREYVQKAYEYKQAEKEVEKRT